MCIHVKQQPATAYLYVWLVYFNENVQHLSKEAIVCIPIKVFFVRTHCVCTLVLPVSIHTYTNTRISYDMLTVCCLLCVFYFPENLSR